MKKKLLLVSLIGVSIVSSAYGACENGISAGSFCIGPKPINWWSAFSWCKANNMELASMYDICPEWDGNTGSEKCPILNAQLASSGACVWTTTVSGENEVFRVHSWNGEVSSWSRNGDGDRSGNRPICK